MRSQATALAPAIESKIRRCLPLLYAWYRKNRRPLPWRSRPTPYRTAVAEFMCQQTRVATVIPYYQRWMQTFPSWLTLARAPGSRVLRMWEGLGYYRRARFLHALAKAAIRFPRRELPGDPAALRELPGIGDYTAGAIASIAFGKPAPAFDGNVARVLGRLTARRGKTPTVATLRALTGRLVPCKNPGLHNQALMELGALVCLPRKPRCASCPLRRSCPSQTNPPSPSPRRTPLERLSEYILFPSKSGKVWLTQTHPQGRWGGLFFLPVVPGKPAGKPCMKVTYPFTRYLVQAAVFTSSRPPPGIAGKWMKPAELRRVTMPAPHRKILSKLGIG